MTPEQRLAEMVKERATRKDAQDLPRTMTQNEINDYVARTSVLDLRIVCARGAMQTIADLTAQRAPDEKWLGHLATWREDFVKRLLAIKSDDRDRATTDLQQGLKLSISNIDRGCSVWPNGAPGVGLPMAEAIRAAGYQPQNGNPGVAWYGSTSDTEARLADFQKRIDAAQRQLDDALLDDTARAAVETKHQAHRDALATMTLRNGVDGRPVAYDEQDNVLDVAAMSEAQRAAFEWFSAAV